MPNKYYHKYQDALEAKGYRVDENGWVRDRMGNQAAGQDRFGNVYSNDPNVTRICQEAEAAMTKTPKPRSKKAVKKEETEVVETLEMVRARDENGHFIADDPSTPDVNEAWVVKTVKKVIKK